MSTYTNRFGSSGTPVSEFTYTYDAWGNLTGIKDGSGHQKTYTYNEYGEVTKATETYANAAATTYTYTYDNGGNLLTETRGNTRHTYTYLSDDQRRSKTVNGKTTTYRYNNGMLLSEQTGDETLRYYYDATGKVTAITYKKGNTLRAATFYTRNLHSDILAIYRSRDSALIGTYE